MEPEDVRAVLEVLDAGGYHAAADLARRNASAMHKQVRRVENELGVKLFVTVGRNVQPTADASQLERDLRDFVAAAELVTTRARELQEGESGVVRVGCYTYQLARFLALANLLFNRKHPNVGLTIHPITADVAHDPEGAAKLLRRGIADVAVTRHLDSNFNHFPLWSTAVIVVMSDDHPWRKRKSVHVDELAGQPLLAPVDHYWSRRQLEHAAETAGTKLDIRLQSSPDALFGSAMAGVGVAVFGDDHIQIPPKQPFPVLLDAFDRRMETDISLTWVGDRPLTRSATEYCEFLRRHRQAIDRQARGVS